MGFDMRTIAILSQKGGAGKTTVAVNLAVAAEMAGERCAIIDLDPPAPAALCGVTAEPRKRRQLFPPRRAGCPRSWRRQIPAARRWPSSTPRRIPKARHWPPPDLQISFSFHAGRPSSTFAAINHTIDLVRIAGKPAAVLLNCVPARGSLAEEAIQAVKGYGIDIAPVQIGQRAAYLHSLTAGLASQEYEPDGKAAAEMGQLYVWICRQVGVYDNTRSPACPQPCMRPAADVQGSPVVEQKPAIASYCGRNAAWPSRHQDDLRAFRPGRFQAIEADWPRPGQYCAGTPCRGAQRPFRKTRQKPIRLKILPQVAQF